MFLFFFFCSASKIWSNSENAQGDHHSWWEAESDSLWSVSIILSRPSWFQFFFSCCWKSNWETKIYMILHYIPQSFWGPRTKQITSTIRQKATNIAWGTLYLTCRNIWFFGFFEGGCFCPPSFFSFFLLSHRYFRPPTVLGKRSSV